MVRYIYYIYNVNNYSDPSFDTYSDGIFKDRSYLLRFDCNTALLLLGLLTVLDMLSMLPLLSL